MIWVFLIILIIAVGIHLWAVNEIGKELDNQGFFETHHYNGLWWTPNEKPIKQSQLKIFSVRIRIN